MKYVGQVVNLRPVWQSARLWGRPPGGSEMTPVVKPKTLYCPNSRGPVELRGFGHALTVVCPQCLSVLDATTPEFQILQKFQEAQRIEPLIPLGARGGISTESNTKSSASKSEPPRGRDAYSWYEYLLFNPFHGFRYLSEYNGHWNFIHMLPGLPQPAIVGKRSGVKYDEQECRRLLQRRSPNHLCSRRISLARTSGRHRRR